MEVLENKVEWSHDFGAGWLAHLEKTGQVDWQLYQHPRNSLSPISPGTIMRLSRLMLITSAGAYLDEEQEPFDASNLMGDYSLRLIPTETPFSQLKYAHDHYEHDLVEKDAQVALPLDLLSRMVLEGRIGSFASSVISFMGYQPDSTRVVDELVPEVVKIAKEHQVHAALLAPI